MGRRCAENKLRAIWSKVEGCLMFYYPKKCDGSLLNTQFCSEPIHIPIENYGKSVIDALESGPSFMQELEKRGYDLTTFKFEIKLKE